MSRPAALVLALVLAAPQTITTPTASASPSSPAPRPPPLAALPSIPRIRVDVAPDHLVATEEIDLPRGDWRNGDVDVYVAFGSPGTPDAFDAHLLSVPDGALEPDESDMGSKLTTERAPRRPRAVHELIGPQEMAGVVVHVPEAALRRALSPGGMAALRFRTLLRFPEGDSSSGHEVLIRLGQEQSTPLTLGRVQIASVEKAPPIARAEARLCGREANPWPLAVTILPQPTAPAALPRSVSGPIAPVLAVRHPSDDLCVRFWLRES